jgi:phosphohistidine phosphatase
MSDLQTSSRIYLLRHARAAWPQAGSRDFDRPLDADGRDEAERIGIAMAINGYVPKKVLCSTARRCVETWDLVARHMTVADVTMTDGLYASDHHYYVDQLRDQTARSILVIGHNPMMDDTALCLLSHAPTQDPFPETGFPTAGLAIIDLAGLPSGAGKAASRLVGFLSPNDT